MDVIAKQQKHRGATDHQGDVHLHVDAALPLHRVLQAQRDGAQHDAQRRREVARSVAWAERDTGSVSELVTPTALGDFAVYPHERDRTRNQQDRHQQQLHRQRSAEGVLGPGVVVEEPEADCDGKPQADRADGAGQIDQGKKHIALPV